MRKLQRRPAKHFAFKPSRIEPFMQIRRATVDNQRSAFEWLERKFRRRGNLAE
jgi:hypothetical protein